MRSRQGAANLEDIRPTGSSNLPGSQEVAGAILRMLITSSLSRARRSGESKESGDAVLIRHRRPARRSWKSRPKTPQLVAPAPSTSLWGHVRRLPSSPSATTSSHRPTPLRRSESACRFAGGAPRCSRSAARPPTRRTKRRARTPRATRRRRGATARARPSPSSPSTARPPRRARAST